MTQQEAETFVTTWQSSNCLATVAEKLGIDKGDCRNRAAGLRRAGVPLKKFSRGIKGINIASLKNLCARLVVRGDGDE